MCVGYETHKLKKKRHSNKEPLKGYHTMSCVQGRSSNEKTRSEDVHVSVSLLAKQTTFLPTADTSTYSVAANKHAPKYVQHAAHDEHNGTHSKPCSRLHGLA